MSLTSIPKPRTPYKAGKSNNFEMNAWLFMRGSKHDLNLRGAYLHMAADAAVSVGVVHWRLSRGRYNVAAGDLAKMMRFVTIRDKELRRRLSLGRAAA